MILAVTLVGCQQPRRDAQNRTAPTGERSFEVRPLRPDDPLARSAVDDPLGFLRSCVEHYRATFHDHECVFKIREPAFGSSELGEEQRIAIRFREQPYSVDMRWIENAVQATRVNYVAGRWRQHGRELALIVPSGLLGLLTPGGVRLDIHSPQVRAASRRPVDDFGFRRTLELIIQNCERASGDPSYSLRCVGEADLENRRCLVFERRLPYASPQGDYPDRLLRIFIDREWRVPIGCFSYADDEARHPLGTYVTGETRFNVGLGDGDF